MAVMGGELVANNDVSVVETSARSVETAITQALAELGRARNEVTVSIIDPGNPGRILGFGAQPARVRVSVRVPGDEAEDDEPSEDTGHQAAHREQAFAPLPEGSANATAVAETARRILSELLHHMHFDEAHIEVVELEPLTLNVRAPDAADLIGRRGETLRAIQFIVGIMVNKALDTHVRITIDIDGYRARREVLLRDLALRFASRVIATGAPVQLEAMPPNERRIVHMVLAEHPDVATESTGEGDNRRIVIMLRH
ncbi:MAG: KH domain-containing protein [Proteobacteria bacterium]|jgi:spoIIIJ-associated protein|nr:KH domain-containing protein [Pseudomonadota bacterium]NBX46225.1 KH domain-containing protein [Chloroflexota bacterium]NBQ31136.1 KH domain-containing protein [Pseudomonadota bacterium]NBQ63015.1 KH domain-containing protein [Pseudomonadota bacterium]NBT02920.1 KH domain-containing protein [Pseudomonadota bacterium]